MAAKKTGAKAKTKAKKEIEVPDFDPYAHLDGQIDKMEKQFSLSAMSISKSEPRFSTGLLSVDLMLSGGLLGGGWYTCFGGEQSCKSTTAMTILSSIMMQKDFKGKASYFDYEGSSQAEYIENIMNSMGVSTDITNVFGIPDEESGGWVVPPRVRYYSPDTGEKFFHYLAKLEKLLPDKVRKNGQWWFVYDNSRENQKALKGKYDKAMFSETNRFWVPAPDGTIQAIVLCDSYPAMLPEAADVKEEGDKSLALQARMFSDGLKRVKSAMRRKRIVVLGVNQMRKVPMAMYGPTETEPCGDALKFYSDVRLRMASCALSAAGAKGKGNLEKEESVIGDGDDTYRYIRIRTHKNKLGGIPNQEVILRLVVENANGDATGFCRTWDAYQFLKSTGQISGTRKAIKFNSGMEIAYKDKGKTKTKSVDFKNPLAGLKLNWLDFKVLIEGTREEIRELCKGLKIKPLMFRNFLATQMKSGVAYQYALDFKRLQASSKRSAVSAADDDDDDED